MNEKELKSELEEMHAKVQRMPGILAYTILSLVTTACGALIFYVFVVVNHP